MRTFVKWLSWAAAIYISIIFLDSLRFKFTGHPTPEHIFTTLKDWSGIGLFYPAGPWLIGIGEALASLLVLVLPAIFTLKKSPRNAARSQFLGALMAMGIMSGAIVFHLFTPLGIETPTEWNEAGTEILAEGSLLFYMACGVWLASLFLLIYRGKQMKGGTKF
ncbi:hypothetical protein [Litorimonas sp. WD9-15]|uniref:hypothetical protein n=1 Tax=Litorimonas sp. WD9-15 TaxID=3418716 RepID=UPI003CFC656D